MVAKINVDMDGSDDTEGLAHNMNDMELLSGCAWDAVKNKQLDVEKEREARAKEVGYVIRKGIWEEVDITECWSKTG